MPSLQTATLTITLDEPAFGLEEMNGPAPDSSGQRRYQIVHVIRNDALVAWKQDLGPVSSFKANQFSLVGDWIDPYKVAELMQMADELRDRDKLPEILQTEPATEQEWLQAYHDEGDRRKMVARKQSMFGPAFSKMRY